MQHTIPVEKIGTSGPTMAQAVEKCVHCGFCLATCPTYKVLGEEMDSPRGRIVLMKSVLEEDINLEEALPYIDRCLGCMACVTACPSGVEYQELLIPFRQMAEEKRERSVIDRAAKTLVHRTLPYPNRFRLAVAAGRAVGPVKELFPTKIQTMIDLLPELQNSTQPLPAIYPAQGNKRARVAFLVGCVQQVLAPQINWATLRVLALNGVEVVIPEGQGCCGALSIHGGDRDSAQRLARKNLSAFPKDIDAIITNAAGCGSGMREYPLLFAGTEYEAEAQSFADLVQDISQFLENLGMIDPPPLPQPLKLAYHDACHLAHAQGITAQPRQILGQIPNIEVISVPEGEICCGSAGTYNIDQPQIAKALGERKARNILKTGADGVVMGNIGCMVQVRKSLMDLGERIPIWHTVEVLDQAYQKNVP
jgi:glycolate oxidase iron-sulfur subunit